MLAASTTCTVKAVDEHPEAEAAHIVLGIVLRGLVPAARKVPITLHADPGLLEWFKVGGDRYQKRTNAVLCVYRDAASAWQAPQF